MTPPEDTIPKTSKLPRIQKSLTPTQKTSSWILNSQNEEKMKNLERELAETQKKMTILEEENRILKASESIQKTSKIEEEIQKMKIRIYALLSILILCLAVVAYYLFC